MALLTSHHLSIVAALSALPACYSPELTDCTVACTSNDECTGDQLCVAGGFCAASGVDCREDPPLNPPPGPAPVRVTLRVEVDGEGKVVVANVGTCMGSRGMPEDDDATRIESCQWSVERGTALQLHAMMLLDKPFDKWEQVCAGQDATCSVTITDAIVAKAKFKK
jgi:hypothetical protein